MGRLCPKRPPRNGPERANERTRTRIDSPTKGRRAIQRRRSLRGMPSARRALVVYLTETHLATETVSLLFSPSPVVTQNCSQAEPLRSVPLLPSSTLSTVNFLVCFLPSHLIVLRWLCHQAAATWLEPSAFKALLFLPDFVCLSEIQSVSPVLHE